MILISGAAGKTGQTIIQALTKRGATVRAFVQRPDHAERVKTLGVEHVVIGDMLDQAAFGQAMTGVRAVYHICPNMHPDEVIIGQRLIAAACESGVKHVVYHSVLHPQTEKMPHHWHKLRVEEQLFESGLDVTVLQPAAYMQNILAGWTTIMEQGLYRVPYPVETRLALVDLLDVAQVAATVLMKAGHAGAVYELVGPQTLSQVEVAQILQQHTGRSVTAEQIPLTEWTETAKSAGLGGYQLETLLKMFQYYADYNFRGNAQVLGWLLKRPPTDFPAFVKRVMLHHSLLL